jgi:DNA-binding NtrC family response regulator
MGDGSPDGQSGKTVLVVDDNREVADLSAAMLEGLGYCVLKAGNAREALARIDAGIHVDAVFSDVVMPGTLNGLDLARRVLTLHPGIALVMATGYSDKLESLHQLDVEVLSKPYHLNELSDALARALIKTGQHADTRDSGPSQTL